MFPRRTNPYRQWQVNWVHFLFVIPLTVLLATSCAPKPSPGDLQNVQNVHVQISQEYTGVDNEIVLPIEDYLSMVFENMGVEITNDGENADAVLQISLRGKPDKATFRNPDRVFYESARVQGKATLDVKNFATLKSSFNGAKHYYSYNYYPHSNTDPRRPLAFATKRALSMMFIELWGYHALFPIFNTSLAQPLLKDADELDEVIAVGDWPKAAAVLLPSLDPDSPNNHPCSAKMLSAFTRTKHLSVKGQQEPKIVKMSPKLRKLMVENIDGLIRAATGPDGFNMNVMTILSHLEGDAQKAIPLFEEALKSGDEDVRASVLRMMPQILPPARRIQLLMDTLQTERASDRRFALRSLEENGIDAASALPLLLEIIADNNDNNDIRGQAAETVAALGADASAVPGLIEALRGTQDKDLRSGILEALEKIGPDSIESLPVVMEIVKDRNENDVVRGNAAKVLRGIGPAARPEIPVLIEVFESTDDTYLQYSLVSSLEVLSGRKLGRSAADWRLWWESQ